MENQDPIRVEWNNQPVLTNAQVAKGLECPVDQLKWIYARHKEQFQEGVHYFKVEGDALHTLKKEVANRYLDSSPVEKEDANGNSDASSSALSFGKGAKCLKLWTCQGVARLSKLIDTPKAWELFTAMEQNYFNPAPVEVKEEVKDEPKDEPKKRKPRSDKANDTVTFNPAKYWRQRYLEEFKPAYYALMKFYPLTTDDLDGEIWNPIPDYEELYHVSNFGRFKSFWGKKPKILRPQLDRKGYLQIGLHKDGKQEFLRVHRLVAIMFIPNPKELPEIDHIDTHRLNCHVNNLRWATSSQNTQFAYDNGLAPQGEKRSDSKLTNEQVRYIRENPDGLNLKQLAEKYDVNDGTISDIQLGKSYKNAGGVIRKPRKRSPNVTEETKRQIRAKYQKGVVGCGCGALGKEFGFCPQTIWNIVNSSSAE